MTEQKVFMQATINSYYYNKDLVCSDICHQSIKTSIMMQKGEEGNWTFTIQFTKSCAICFCCGEKFITQPYVSDYLVTIPTPTQ